MSRWWRWWRPGRHERAATRNWRHAARSLLSRCCVRCALFSAKVRRPLGLWRRLTLARHWRWSCSDGQRRLCSWRLGRELPDRCFVVRLGSRARRERHCRSIGGRRWRRNRPGFSWRWTGWRARAWYWRCYLGQRASYKPVSTKNAKSLVY